MLVQPYLFFDGRCEEALEFYRGIFGGEFLAMKYKDSPEPGHTPPGAEDKIMHASFKIGDSLVMASDGRAQGSPKFEGIALSVSADTIPEAERVFSALSDGGQVEMPLVEAFFSPRFGMLRDKFGVFWMVVVAHK
jgi:PhnB protein